jgi:hypothetical protein
MQLWQRDNDGTWSAHRIDAAVFLHRDAHGVYGLAREPRAAVLAAIVALPENASQPAVLVPAPDARITVDGFPALSLQALRDHDEVGVAGEHGARWLFGAYAPPVVRRHCEEDGNVSCVRCKLELAPNAPVTACVACGRLYHVDARRLAGDSSPHSERARGGDDTGHAGLELDCDTLEDKCAGCGCYRSELLWTPLEDDAHA